MVSVQSPVSILTHQGQISQIGAYTTLGDNLISLELERLTWLFTDEVQICETKISFNIDTSHHSLSNPIPT